MPRELPHGTLTILFTDLVDSTGAFERLGDAGAQELRRAHFLLLRESLTAHGGEEVKTMGDGFMVVFQSALDAVSCAVAMQQAVFRHNAQHAEEQHLGVRVGLHAGEPTREEGDYFGMPVVIAKRVCDGAGGGQILATELVRGLVAGRGDAAFTDRGERALKGVAEPTRVYEVAWSPAAEPAVACWPLPPVLASIGRVAFVARGAEISKLREAWKQALAGQGQLVMLAGEPGIGKTRLAAEFAREAHGQGATLLFGRSDEDALVPYQPFVESLRYYVATAPVSEIEAAVGGDTQIVTLLPEVAERVPGLALAAPAALESERFRLFEAVAAVLVRASSERPVVLLLDDLHWADKPTLLLLRHILRGADPARLLLVGTHRETDLARTHPLAEMLADLRRERGYTRVALRGLDEDGVDAMVDAWAGHEVPRVFTRAVHEQTEGNPFFIEEVLDHLRETGVIYQREGQWTSDATNIAELSIPEGVREVIGRRLGRLSENGNLVLAHASVLGREFEFETLAGMTGLAEDAVLSGVEEALVARLIEETRGRAKASYAFSHALVRQTLYEEMTLPRKQKLHLRAADAIEGYADRSPALDSELARHYLAAGSLADPLRVIAALRRVGSAALDAYANVEALAHFEDALKRAERLPGYTTAELADIVHHLGQAQYRVGNWRRSQESLDRALALYADAGDAVGQAQVLYSKSSLATFRSSPSDALSFLAQARELTPDDERLKALVLQLEAQNLVDLRRYPDAAVAVAEALAIAESASDAYISNHARLASGYFALATLDMPRAVDDYSRVSEARVAQPHERMAAASRRAIALACLGELDAAAEGSARARKYFRGMREADDVFGDPALERDPYEFGVSCIAEGVTAIARGCFADAYRFLREAIEACGDPPSAFVVRTLTPMMVQALHHLGRYDEATSLLQTLLGPADQRRRAFWHLHQALQAAARGDDDAADADLPVRRATRPDIQSLPVAALAAETAVARRDVEAARLQVDALEFLHEHGVAFTLGWVVMTTRLLGAVYTLIGNELRAAPMLESALSLAQSTGARAEVALTRLELAELHAARADTAASRSHLAEAEKLFTTLGMRSSDARVRALAHRLEPVARLADGLTEQEVDILRAVAAGLTNRAIALERSCREDAIQRQLTAIYRKIGVKNRAAAIAYAYRKGIAAHGE